MMPRHRIYEGNNRIGFTITTKQSHLPMIMVNEPLTNYSPKAREYEVNGWRDVSYPLFDRDYKAPKVIMIPEDTKQGYALAEDGDGVYISRPEQLRIRKLTPREAWRLMGIDDKDFDKAQEVPIGECRSYNR